MKDLRQLRLEFPIPDVTEYYDCDVRLIGTSISKSEYVGTESEAQICISYTPRARLRHSVAKSLGNQARGVQPACTMTTQNSKIRLISSIALKSRLITYLST